MPLLGAVRDGDSYDLLIKSSAGGDVVWAMRYSSLDGDDHNPPCCQQTAVRVVSH